ncbi:tubulin-folding cofactor D [Artemisia annua]|uniref:Tubulin-folding cofactor D n=1 Tax=Artemisia annua TaxID=35608 RepID=A0A2U1KQ49_ARTAN|nr:tubulin-folding cofactor D [Artemisia annua]
MTRFIDQKENQASSNMSSMSPIAMLLSTDTCFQDLIADRISLTSKETGCMELSLLPIDRMKKRNNKLVLYLILLSATRSLLHLEVKELAVYELDDVVPCVIFSPSASDYAFAYKDKQTSVWICLCHRKYNQKVVGVVPAIDKARLYRGKVGEIICCYFSIHLVYFYCKHNFDRKIKRNLLDNLNENLRQPNGQIQLFI